MTSSESTTQASATGNPDESDQFTLQILSPSVNVPQPLLLENLPFTTTVRQVKERIRDAISAKPSDEAQRLIHRGRLLTRDTETMRELFGEEIVSSNISSAETGTDMHTHIFFIVQLRSTNRQPIHLVLRDLVDRQGAAPTPSPPESQQPGHDQLRQGYATHPGQPHAGLGLGASPHPNISFALPAGAGLPAQNGTQYPPGWTRERHLQNHVQIMARLAANPAQLQGSNPMVHGMQSRGAPGSAASSTTPSRTDSPLQPETTSTVIREGVGPDGHRWRVTVNQSVTSLHRPLRASSPFPSAGVPPPTASQPWSVPNLGPTGAHDFPNPPHPPDMVSATRAMADAMRRNATSSSLANLESHHSQQPIVPGVTTPLIPSRTGSAAGSFDPLRATERPTNASNRLRTSPASSTTPEVYILSSPRGPQAILINDDSALYHSPQLSGRRPVGPPISTMPFHTASGSAPHARHGIPQIVQRTIPVGGNAMNAHIHAPPAQHPQIRQAQGVQMPPPVPAQFGHGLDHPQIQAVRIAQIWPHITMLLRLAFFIWWFTSPTSSWSRWLTVISVAVVLFLANAGAFNPWADQIWIPLRRHLENLMPLAADAGADQRRGPAVDDAQVGDGNAANPARPRDPNPADAAARLVQQRRLDNANWLLNRVRRLERAGILFLASLAPGLAERHIAQMEAEARAERQRQQEAEAAATATSSTTPEGATENDAAAGQAASELPSHDEVHNSGTGAPGGEARQSTDAAPPEEPLVAI